MDFLLFCSHISQDDLVVRHLVVAQNNDVWCPQPVGGAKERLQGGSIIIRIRFDLL